MCNVTCENIFLFILYLFTTHLFSVPTTVTILHLLFFVTGGRSRVYCFLYSCREWREACFYLSASYVVPLFQIILWTTKWSLNAS